MSGMGIHISGIKVLAFIRAAWMKNPKLAM